MELLTSNELNGLLAGILNRLTASYYLRQHAVFHILYHHGFRIMEVKDLHNWTDNLDGTITAPTSKLGDPRTIQKADLPQLAVTSIETQTPLLFRRSYSSYERLFNRLAPVKKLWVGDKPIGSHVFRHNRMKQLHLGGMSYEDIRVLFGLQNVSVVTNYVASEIWAEYHGIIN